MIYNPPEIAQMKEVESQHDKDNVSKRREDAKDSLTSLTDSKGALKVAIKMEKVVPIFIQQLKMLLGVSSSEWVSCDPSLVLKGGCLLLELCDYIIVASRHRQCQLRLC